MVLPTLLPPGGLPLLHYCSAFSLSQDHTLIGGHRKFVLVSESPLVGRLPRSSGSDASIIVCSASGRDSRPCQAARLSYEECHRRSPRENRNSEAQRRAGNEIGRAHV